jgi:hypothetical protein
MTSNSSDKPSDNASERAKPITQSEHRKRRLAEQLRKNLKNRKTQARERRNFDKHSDK